MKGLKDEADVVATKLRQVIHRGIGACAEIPLAAGRRVERADKIQQATLAATAGVEMQREILGAKYGRIRH